MVGVPKSKGCQLCRYRSIKCDETRPSCLHCIRGGRECPGYSRAMKFVDEAPRLRRKASQSISGKPTCTKTCGTLKPPSFTSGSLELAQIVSCCVGELFPLHHMTLQLSLLGSWLWYVPNRLGKSMALDSAARSLALAHFARVSKQEAATLNSLESYSQALAFLSRALYRPDTRYSSETVAATMLLGLFESFGGLENTSWIKHAGGTGALLQVRGARRHESEFDYYMFLACRGPIISGALMSGKSCYLDSPEWMALSAYNSNLFPSMRKSFQQYDDLCNLSCRVPRFVMQCKLQYKQVPSKELSLLIDDGLRLQAEFKQWYYSFLSSHHDGDPPASEVPSSISGPYPSMLMYKDTYTASLLTSYYAYLLALNTAVDTFQQFSWHRDENEELAHRICMSVEYCSRAGVCGAACMKLALPHALNASPKGYKDWIKDKMKMFS